jgi:hypothetical protein
VIRQLGRDLVDRQMVGISAAGGKALGEFPNGIVAGREYDTSPLQNHDAVVLRRERALHRLEIRGIMRRRRRRDNECVADCRRPVSLTGIVPRILVVERQMRRAMGR